MSQNILRPALVLGLLLAVRPFAIDVYLPALTHIGQDLGVNIAMMQGTITSYFLAVGAAQIFCGPC
jgi:MFS transporter, DHA1 family, multidrug resistance protein